MSDLNTKELLDQVNRLTAAMTKRYISILERLPLIQKERPFERENPDDFFHPTEINRDRVAVNNLQIEIDAQGLITTAERILTLTRRLKELWLFGNLNTVGRGDTLDETEQAVRDVADSMRKLIAQK